MIKILENAESLDVDVYERIYDHASVYVLAIVRAGLACLPLTVFYASC